jgi:hypothetical protein
VFLTRPPRSAPEGAPVRLACIRHAASVDPEPGSNSPPSVPGALAVTPRTGDRSPPEPPARPAGTPQGSLCWLVGRFAHRPRSRPVPKDHAPRTPCTKTPCCSVCGTPPSPRAWLRPGPRSRRPAGSPPHHAGARPRLNPPSGRAALHLSRWPSCRWARRSPCIATGRRSPAPLPGLLERLV